MWWSLTQTDNAISAAACRGQFIFCEETTGQLLAIVPEQGLSPSIVLGEGWTKPHALAAHPNGTLLVADGNGDIWMVDPGNAQPANAQKLTSGLGRIEQMVASASGQFLYALVGSNMGRRSLTLPGVTAPSLGWDIGMPWPPYSPWLNERNRLVRIELANGNTTSISRNHPNASGLVITGDGANVYITERGSGSLVAVEVGTGARSIITTNLDNPGCCVWLDEAQGLLAAVEESTGAVAIIDITSAFVRRVPGCPGQPVTPVVMGDLLIVAARQNVAAIEARAVMLDRVVLAPPTTPIYRGGYARVPVDLGSTGILFSDIQFTIAEGPEFAAVSPSKDDTFDPTKPDIMLLAGPISGSYTLEARDPAGRVVAKAPFYVTDQWNQADGPPMAFTGANPLYAGGGTWGTLFNGVWPFLFTYGPGSVSGTRRVALIFVNTTDTALPAGTDTLYRDALINGVTGTDGVQRSVRSYYDEISLGQLTIAAAGESTVTVPKTWADYTQPFSATDNRFSTRDELIADAMWLAQNNIDFTQVDIAVFIVASPNGGQALPPDTLRRFTWPIASGGTYLLSRPMPPFALLYWWWKSLPWAVMPAEWQTLDARRVFETLSHEIGHTIGLTDLYGDSREIGMWDIMSSDVGLPALSLPHRHVLGWIDANSLRTYNFLVENPVDEEIVLSASELLAGGIPADQFSGVVIEVAHGWRYYFEYRSRQNVIAGVDPGPTQVADQSLPLDQRVIGIDVVAGWYHPPVSRKPIRLLGDDGDGEGVKLAPAQDYEELDPSVNSSANSTFRLEVLSADDDKAHIQVRYQPVPAPEPPWPHGPDPSIRPWPGGDNWRSPDIRIENALGLPDPWAEHNNTIIATVTNAGSVDARNVKVGFWVKDFTISDAGPETFLGWATGDIMAGTNRDFSISWVPPVRPSFLGMASVHFCLIVRIAPHAQGTPPRGEVNPFNNEAQSNYTLMWTLSGSPFSRQRLPVQIANPYTDRAVEVRLHAEQKLNWYRTYLEHTSVRLEPGETRSVEVMVECVAEEPPFRDRVPQNRLYREPNIVSAIGVILDPDANVAQPIGGATIEVRAARASEIVGLDVSRHYTSGRVRLLADRSAPSVGGDVVVATRANAPGKEIIYKTKLSPNGEFTVETPDFAALPSPLDIDLVYLGGGEVGPSAIRITID